MNLKSTIQLINIHVHDAMQKDSLSLIIIINDHEWYATPLLFIIVNKTISPLTKRCENLLY